MKLEQLKEQIKNKKSVYVMHSTLNQMVNYIPLHHFEFDSIYNITSDKNSNADWDDNLKEVLDKMPTPSIEKIKINEHATAAHIQKEVEDKIEDLLDLKEEVVFVWNITGGQRFYNWAVHDIVKAINDKEENDSEYNNVHYVLYLNGNDGHMYIDEYKNKVGGPAKFLAKKQPYDLSDHTKLNLDIAFQLMGFESFIEEGSEKEERNILSEDYDGEFNQERKDFYEVFWKLYKSGNKILLEALRISNEKKYAVKILQDINKDNEGQISYVVETRKKGKKQVVRRKNGGENLVDVLSITEKTIHLDKEKLVLNKPDKALLVDELICDDTDKTKVKISFGKILEDLTIYLILKAIDEDSDIRSKIIGLYGSTKNTNEKIPVHQNLDEFDVIILTTTGQIINIECKSGGMEGDGAKSTNYSTYAIAGVYGLPILVTPRVDKDDKRLEHVEYKKVKLDDNTQKAINAAEKVGIDIWYLKDIKKELRKKLGLSK